MHDATVLSTGKVILVVDDDPAVAGLLAEVLVAEGHTVHQVHSGRQALERIEERNYDLIISDIRMPGLDGAGLYQELTRAHPELLRRIIFFSGDSLGPLTQAFLRETVVPSLAKPFDLVDLLRTIDEVLRAA